MRQAPRPTSRATTLAASTVAMGTGAAPTFLTGYLGPALRGDLGLSSTWLGLLAGAFYGATGTTSLLAAAAVSRLGARWCVVGDQVVVAVVLVAAAATSSPAVLMAGSLLAGSAYALANAGTSLAVISASRPDQAGTALAVKTAGVPGTATLLGLGALPAATIVGWQGVCLVLATVAGVNAALALALPGTDRRARTAPADCGRERLPPGFAWVVLAATCFVVGTNPLSSWLVLSLVEGGTSRTTAGLVSAAGTGAGVIAMVLAARLGDRSGPERRATTAARVAAVSLTGTALLWAGTHLSLLLVAVGAVLGLPGAMAGAGFAHAVTVDRAPHAVGRATAIMSSGYYLGALASPLTFGALADGTGGYDASWAVTTTAMAVCVAGYLVVQRRVPPGAGGRPARSRRSPLPGSSIRNPDGAPA